MNQNISYSNQTNQQLIAANPELHFCFKCNWEGRGTPADCPQCGSVLFSQQNVRRRGVVLIGLGLFLSIFMLAISAAVTTLLMNAADEPRYGDRLENEGHMFVLVFLIFGSVIMIGVSAVAMGLWQYVYGRRNMILLKLFFTLIGITFAVAGIFSALAN
jgi:hypothetical protein